jgi:hypothetical protein
MMTTPSPSSLVAGAASVKVQRTVSSASRRMVAVRVPRSTVELASSQLSLVRLKPAGSSSSVTL